MIDTKEFSEIRKEMEKEDGAREAVIKRSRDILKASKQAIFALHRGDTQQAKELIGQARKVKEALEAEFGQPGKNTGSFGNALEEYGEACTFLAYLEGRFVTRDEIGVSNEQYLGAMADLTGELGRMAVVKATDRDLDAVRAIKKFVEAVYGEFVQYDFRNGELRRKYDSIKYNLQKIENVLYELTLKK